VFRSFGWTTSRQCRKLGLSWRQPSEFPRRSLLAARVALLGIDRPWLVPFAQQVMLANFAQDLDIGSELIMQGILDRLELPAAALIGAAQEDSNKANRLDDAIACAGAYAAKYAG
jgi:2-hydroxychromene-2-carboxylate isomerase